jgi:hypothetical protein
LTIGNELVKQFNSNWNMLRQAIDKAPIELWSETGEWSYSWNVYHIIETAAFYNRDTPEGMEWGKKAGISWENDSESTIIEKKSEITKEGLIIYLEETKNRISSKLKSLKDPEWLKKDDFAWFDSIMEKYLYSLRHDMHHIGELNKTLRDRECERIKWT